jgi:hypothetical protein
MDKQNSRVGRRTRAAIEDPRTRDIRGEIEDTREQMSETVNEIQERLTPSHLAGQAKESVKQAVSERARDVADSRPVRYARSNPIPTAMVGIGAVGLAWLAFARDDRDNDYPRRGYQGTSYAGSDVYRGLDENDDFESPRTVRRSAEQVTRTMNENPLLLGAAAAIGGALVGMAVRETEPENRLMGSTRDSMVEEAKQTVQEKVNTVTQAAGIADTNA